MRYSIVVMSESVEKWLETNDLDIARTIMIAIAKVTQSEVAVYDNIKCIIIESSRDGKYQGLIK